MKLRCQIRQQREQEARALLEQKERDKRIQDQESRKQQERAVRIQKDGLLDQQEREVAAKRLKLNEGRVYVANFLWASVVEMDISDISTATCASVDAETQTEEYHYMLRSNKYQAPDQKYFHSNDNVRFYTKLSTNEILMVAFHHVAPHVARNTQSINRFQEFIIVLMKLRLH